MNILISGASGFIGKHLSSKLLSEGHKVFAVVRPSTDTSKISKKITVIKYTGNVDELILNIKKYKIDGAVHLASLFLAQHTPTDISELVSSNILFSTTLLEAVEKTNVSWFINTGTFWQHYENKAYSPVNLYAATKQAFEIIAQYYLEAKNINFVTIKLSDTYGPHDTRAKIFNMWKKISETKETLEMSPGKQVIDISYIDDVVSGFVKMIDHLQKDTKKKFRGQSFAIRARKVISLKELSKIFEKVTGLPLNINWGKKPYRPREVMKTWTKGKIIPGWKPTVSLEEGIKKTFAEIGDSKKKKKPLK